MTTSSNFFENIFDLIKIVQLQIKFEGSMLSHFVKNRTFPTTCSMKNNTEKDDLKSRIIKVEAFLERTFTEQRIQYNPKNSIVHGEKILSLKNVSFPAASKF